MTLKVLFLDFDGVVHSADRSALEYQGTGTTHTGSWLFSQLPHLDDLLVRCPDVSIVISSSWQHCHSLPDLREFLGAAGDRVIGTTHSIAPALDGSVSRYSECCTVAATLVTQKWVMVDDQPSMVWGSHIPSPSEMARVVFCDPVLGLTPAIVDILAKKLS